MTNNHYRSVMNSPESADRRCVRQALQCAAILAVLLAVIWAAFALPGCLDQMSAGWSNIGA